MSKAKCPSCKDESDFSYVGYQAGDDPVDSRHLYTCKRCGSTVAYKSIVEFNGSDTQKRGDTPKYYVCREEGCNHVKIEGEMAWSPIDKHLLQYLKEQARFAVGLCDTHWVEERGLKD
ncbi:hypothetical protein KY328_06005 [Candidatus Woesearchaeota archaeon]|nr:hypothetical protein [Candidatus Woesearchaeota archaeon]MBW3022454.1 hypothetical protein [Candidatus Woesearchaeota archaeon]